MPPQQMYRAHHGSDEALDMPPEVWPGRRPVLDLNAIFLDIPGNLATALSE
jgi:hypothetical protein